MVTRYGGHVVNISATLAEVANSSAPSVLAALTKGGLAAATRSLAVEYASRGVRVNAVSPGIIQTPVHPADSYEELGDRLPPLGRAGQVSDVVDGILFLEASPYITGEILHIDGGQIAGLTAPCETRLGQASLSELCQRHLAQMPFDRALTHRLARGQQVTPGAPGERLATLGGRRLVGGTWLLAGGHGGGSRGPLRLVHGGG